MKIMNIVLCIFLVLVSLAAAACLPRPTTSTTPITTPVTTPTTKPTTTPTTKPTTTPVTTPTTGPTTTPTSTVTTTATSTVTTTATSTVTTTTPVTTPTTTVPTTSPTTTPVVTSRTMEFSTPPASLKIYIGDKFIFSIESNPSTGYTWQVASGMNENVVKLNSQVFIETPSTATPPPVGVPGKDKFAFTAAGAGQAKITLNYVRPWETDVEPEQTQVINVTVTQPGSLKEIESDIPPSSLEIYTADRFVFSIESNPSTGYTWQVASGMNENVVKLSSQEFIATPSTTTPPPVGVPGKEKFAFTAIGAGQATITLNYVRPWETDVAPEQTVVISVTVK